MAAKKLKYLVADFETTIGDQKLLPKNRSTEVWLSCFADIDNFETRDRFYTQFDIKNFFIQLVNYCNKFNGEYDFTVFFHNLKFDGSFILNFFLKNDIDFTCFINALGIWYNIKLDLDGYTINFRDSHKILNFKLSQIAKLFNTPSPKGKTPLLEFKPEKVNEEWIDYIETDVEILAHGIKGMYHDEGFTKFTSASQALHEFKKIVNYRKKFPILEQEIDTYVRKAYKGGWTFVNPTHQGKLINESIIVYDIHSMYPSTMLEYPMPYGLPEYYEGEPKCECYVANVWLKIDLKDGFLPTLQTKDLDTSLALGIKKTDYIKSTNGDYYEFTLTNYDLNLIKDHYNYDIIYKSYYKFKTDYGLFDDYILKYKNLKENAKTPAEKQKAKIMLNSLYGKFGSKIFSIMKDVYLEDGVLKFKNCDEEEVKPNYIPLAVFITSISRHKIIRAAQANYDVFIYADTDSLHLLNKRKIYLETHESKFGTWGLEGEFIRGKYLRSKLYMEETVDGKIEVKGAGMTDEIKKQVNFENFEIGTKYNGKKATKQVNGGMIIYETEFTIKKDGIF